MMTKLDAFKALAHEFTQLMELPSIDFGPDAGFGLEMGDMELNVGYREDSDEVVVISYLNEYSEQESPSLYRKLLDANFAFTESGHGAFGLTPDENQVTFSTKMPLQGMTVKEFYELISHARRISKRWLEQIEKDCEEPIDLAEPTFGIRI
ncbi:type III secretion system chaperone [Pleionea sp. CnH1-48]|uniref:type III secretion system chaperone n=1 Tax=Pleionea sp. CnH1-48 TaxID=2954494 RepID=UPI00209735AA|nr:type III secretion system chaperone [Pleionea sp. CnH1-48]MCO7224711.1 type III secretion system chaperone [Pleionea sp. CnH1-48]